ncbi:hypothetical protein [Terribacillus saccharophilus]|uniref:hypothetical protein n=1 Tax=Terribacillus saccharophilus TaxID=361277 RepID=UPI000C9C38EF|nr:hypothetical protein [Terribacillus goriensis]
MAQSKKSKQQNNNNVQNQFSINDLLVGKDLDIIAAILLLNGKLKVDSIETFRRTGLLNVTLIGQFPTSTNNKNPLTDFLDNNGDLTMDEVFDAIKQRMK